MAAKNQKNTLYKVKKKKMTFVSGKMKEINKANKKKINETIRKKNCLDFREIVIFVRKPVIFSLSLSF